MMAAQIPVIDLQGLAEAKTKLDIAKQLHKAFSYIGFVYLRNHGIAQDKIDEVNRVSGKFFELPVETKKLYKRKSAHEDHGYVSLENEKICPNRPADLKEAFNITLDSAEFWPNAEVPEFEATMMDLWRDCIRLNATVLELIAIGLGLEDPHFFVKQVNPILQNAGNGTTMRCLYYPPVHNMEVKKDQVRLGEHSDYGLITLLFQDQIGGLQVFDQTTQGFIEATPIPGTVLVNLGLVLQRWTSDQLKATEHRVLIPEEEVRNRIVRRSIAFFVHSDHECVIKSLDGQEKYEPIKTGDFLNSMFDASYGSNTSG